MSGWRARASSVYHQTFLTIPNHTALCYAACRPLAHVVSLVHMLPPLPNLALLVFGSRVLRGAYVRSDILLLFFMPVRPLNVVCMV